MSNLTARAARRAAFKQLAARIDGGGSVVKGEEKEEEEDEEEGNGETSDGEKIKSMPVSPKEADCQLVGLTVKVESIHRWRRAANELLVHSNKTESGSARALRGGGGCLRVCVWV